MGLGDIGKFLLIAAGFLAVVGVILLLLNHVPFLGKLPFDFHFKKGNFEVFFPLATFIIISIVLTIIVNLVLRLLHR